MDELYDEFIEKTDYLTETKGLLKDRINSLGGSITSGTTFRDYLVWLDSLYEALDEKTITGLPDSLEGKCEQEGTPTPSSPIPINITTGRQVVSVCGKNLFNKNNASQILNAYINTTGYVLTSIATMKTAYINCQPNTTYTISKIRSARFAVASYTSITFGTGSTNGLSNRDADSLTITTGANDKYLAVFYYHTSDTLSEETIRSSIMIEKGNQATTYEEYKGNDYEINLGKNLWNTDFERAEYNSSGVKVSTNVWLVNTTKINVIPNTTYTISQTEHPIQYRIICFNGTTYLSQSSSSQNATTGLSSYTFTTPNNCNGIYIQFRSTIERIAQGTYTVEIGDITNAQLEKGTGTSYSPYKTPIYLGKIGTYQDYIFRNTTENPLYDSNLEEGQWYIHKEIGRVVLNGASSETWALTGTNPFYRYRYLDDALYLADGNNVISNQFSYNFINATNTNIGISISSTLELRIRETTMQTLANWKTWLSTHPLEVYYVLNTPTNTLIEDEELINQLNEIEIFTVISEDFYN